MVVSVTKEDAVVMEDWRSLASIEYYIADQVTSHKTKPNPQPTMDIKGPINRSKFQDFDPLSSLSFLYDIVGWGCGVVLWLVT